MIDMGEKMDFSEKKIGYARRVPAEGQKRQKMTLSVPVLSQRVCFQLLSFFEGLFLSPVGAF
jgi:hypothetical protein